MVSFFSYCFANLLPRSIHHACFFRGSLSKHERRKYIDAVLCMLQKPSLSDPTEVPGARNRFDDFLAVHINQTLTIHGTVSTLLMHEGSHYLFQTDYAYLGQLPHLAPLLHMGVRTGSPQ